MWAAQGLALRRFQINIYARMEGQDKEGRKERWGKGREGRLKVVGIFLLSSSSKDRVLDRHRMKKSSASPKTHLPVHSVAVSALRLLHVFVDFFHGIRNGKKNRLGKPIHF